MKSFTKDNVLKEHPVRTAEKNFQPVGSDIFN